MNQATRLLQLAVFAATVTAAQPYAQSSQVSGHVLDSEDEGYYSFPLALPGAYELKVEKEGFDTYTRSGIMVQTGADQHNRR